MVQYTLENSFRVSYIIKHTLIIDPEIPLYLPRRNENRCPHKNLYVTISSFVYNSPELKTTQMSIN